MHQMPLALRRLDAAGKEIVIPSKTGTVALASAPAPVPIYLQPEFKSNAPTAEPIRTF